MSCQVKTSGQCQLRNRKTPIFFNCFIANRLSHCWSRCIICFKIKNPPTLHSTPKIQPTTLPTFAFSVFASVRKKWGYKKKLMTVVLILVYHVFYSDFIISLKRYDMVVTTFLYIIIIFCYVNKLNNSMSNFANIIQQVVDFWFWNRLYSKFKKLLDCQN
jgi:hypothetical protein